MWRSIKRVYYLARLKDPAYKFLFEPGPEDEAEAIDCETTGLDPRNDDIVTVAAIKIRGNRILTSERFQATLRPSVAMNPEAIKVHRLREREVAMGGARWRTYCLPCCVSSAADPWSAITSSSMSP